MAGAAPPTHRKRGSQLHLLTFLLFYGAPITAEPAGSVVEHDSRTEVGVDPSFGPPKHSEYVMNDSDSVGRAEQALADDKL
ncbi:MAG: hypothetical protein KDD69_19145, partial [Bdellovibrionales bacterium]|nr:hypothetical protein [Bdellovibrionales bacterium]